MQLIIFSIRRQWSSNLLQKPVDENPLASKLLILIYKLKAKELLAHIRPNFLCAPCYSVTINKKPEKILHILQCDGDLTMWHVEGVSLGPPSLHQGCYQAMVNLSTRDPRSPSKPSALMMSTTRSSIIGSQLENSSLWVRQVRDPRSCI